MSGSTVDIELFGRGSRAMNLYETGSSERRHSSAFHQIPGVHNSLPPSHSGVELRQKNVPSTVLTFKLHQISPNSVTQLNVAMHQAPIHQTPPYGSVSFHFHATHERQRLLDLPGSSQHINHAAIVLNPRRDPMFLPHVLEQCNCSAKQLFVIARCQNADEGNTVGPRAHLLHLRKQLKGPTILPVDGQAQYHGAPRRNVFDFHLTKHPLSRFHAPALCVEIDQRRSELNFVIFQLSVSVYIRVNPLSFFKRASGSTRAENTSQKRVIELHGCTIILEFTKKLNGFAEKPVSDIAGDHCAVRHVVFVRDCVEHLPSFVYQAVLAVASEKTCTARDVFAGTFVEHAASGLCAGVVRVGGDEGGGDVGIGEVAESEDERVELLDEGERRGGFGEEEGEGAGVGANCVV
ncbi:hypothetical protein V8G54_022971 [Vigna mungo]|uniref:Uncharacterized protein n=1 Tax=Vigna mungo TaxID=3915 RepID=A0AAQ3N404_VIGMU